MDKKDDPQLQRAEDMLAAMQRQRDIFANDRVVLEADLVASQRKVEELAQQVAKLTVEMRRLTSEAEAREAAPVLPGFNAMSANGAVAN